MKFLVGMIMPYVGSLNQKSIVAFGEAGWLFCNGDYVSKIKYDELYDVIRNEYGESKNNSFRLPDYRGHFLREESSKGGK